jgi:hypothetical protein
MLDQDCGLEASPRWVRRRFLADTRASKLKGNTVTVTTRPILWMEFITVPDTNILTVNTELTKIKVSVVINLKWRNLDYPSGNLVRRPTLKVSCDHQTLYFLGGGRVPDFEV